MSTIKVGTLLAADGSTTTQPSIPALDKRMATAWVNFNGTGTVAIRDSYGVSSITDFGAGNYQVIFTTALANANYCPLLSLDSDLDETPFTYSQLASSYKIGLYQGGVYVDAVGVYSAVFGGQA